MRPRRLLARYAAGLTFAYLLTVAEVIAIVLALTAGRTATTENILTAAVLICIGTATTAVGAVLIVAPTLRWVGSGRAPTEAERQTALKTLQRQSMIAVAPWVLTAAVLVPLNLDAGPEVKVVIASAIVFGAIATVPTGFLFTLRTLRPVLASVSPDPALRGLIAPGVRARLVLVWTVFTALPGLTIALLLIMRSRGWLTTQSTSIDLALLVLALVAVVLGLRAMILVSMSISDPVGEVVDAMAEVERGRIDHAVDVYEWSEIGRLQRGFNSMVAGLRERDRLRDLFGRHVGEEVARRAIDADESFSGDEREVTVLFVDLVESTQLAATREPHEVAEVLNDFFRIVVDEVDAHHGLINKFQGDAALAVFGTPLRIDDPAAAGLTTARSLRRQLRSLPVDFGIGVSAGPVFAGNIGGQNRYEYTVVGDAVNEAARLADLAKEYQSRVLCSAAVLECAGEAEQSHWSADNSEVLLRGRTSPTQLWAPKRNDVCD
ncbi:adenylate/guanylate cyclase domain-containing protein [Mycolicibacterium sp. XJ879]